MPAAPLQIRHSLPQGLWQDFVLQNPQGNIFHTPQMFQVYTAAKNHAPHLWAAQQGAQILALFLPVELSLYPGLARHFTTRAVVYGSTLCQPDAQGYAALDELLRHYRRNASPAVLYTELRNLHQQTDQRTVLESNGFIYEDHLDYLVDLNRPPEEIFNQIGKRTQKNLRQEMKKNRVFVEELRSRDQIPEWYRVLKRTYQARSVPLADISLFYAAYDILTPLKMVRFSQALINHTVAAVSVELLYKDRVFGWYGGTQREFTAFIPNEILTWSILQWGAQNGYALYDFGGAGKPGEPYGVRDFKAKFGGQLVNFGRYVYKNHPMRLALSQTVYELLRRWLYSARPGPNTPLSPEPPSPHSSAHEKEAA